MHVNAGLFLARYPGAKDSLVVMDEISLISQMAKISGDRFRRKDSTLQMLERITYTLEEKY